MNKIKVFIDGQEGTTGLKIYERFQHRDDIDLLKIDTVLKKDLRERKKFINSSDFTFLCLPDTAAIEAVSLVENDTTRIIDASTAHRTHPKWAYGFPELSETYRRNIENSARVAVPGCYASGFLALVYPVICSGVMDKAHPVTCHAVSGYSGAGKKMIGIYESKEKSEQMYAPRQYALAQDHKHLPEMRIISGLEFAPMFNPAVDDYYSGMVVSVPVITRTLAKKVTLKGLWEILNEHYKDQYFVNVMPLEENEALASGFLSANNLAETNNMQIFVFGNDEQILLASRFDNLGKGASGAAIQCMNIMLGIDETTGLIQEKI